MDCLQDCLVEDLDFDGQPLPFVVDVLHELINQFLFVCFFF